MELSGERPLGDRAENPTGRNTGDHAEDTLGAHPDLRALGRRLRLEMDETLGYRPSAGPLSGTVS
jgi:hypothetical protein